MLRQISRLLPRELDGHQQRVYLRVFSVFFLTLSGYWLVRPMKMGVFVALAGISNEPQAKIGTVVILVPLLMAYNKLYTAVSDPKRLVGIVCAVYTTLFLFISIALAGRDLSPTAEAPTGYGDPVGWAVYWTIESFGSVVVAMLWSTTASITDSPTAAVVYPIIVIAQQSGAICGATVATYTQAFGFPSLFLLQAGVVALVGVFMRSALDIHEIRLSVGRALSVSSSPKKDTAPPTGLLEGLRLIFTRRYVTGIFVISTFAEVVSTIMDFQMKMIARQTYTTGGEFSAFMGKFGQASNAVSLLLAVFGTQKAMKRFGLKTCLLAFPSCLLVLISIVYISPHLNVLFWGMVAIKALGYSLNGPSRELLYIRTSKDIKFKAKSWIDMFGTRGAKAIGSVVNNTFRHSLDSLLVYGSVVSSGFVGVWLAAALGLGRLYTQLERDELIVE